MTTLRVKDLPMPRANTDLPGGGCILARQPVLYCHGCGDASSANPGDYWDVPKDTPLECGHCGEDLTLAIMREVAVPLGEPEEALSAFLEAVWRDAE